MRRWRLFGVLVGSVSALALIAAGPVSAATQFGDACSADDATEAPITFFEISHPENPLPTAAPVSGVLTRWQMNVVGEAPFPIPVTLKVLRLSPGPPPIATVQGEASGTLLTVNNSFAARIPIQAGDRIGSSGGGPVGALICQTSTAGTAGISVDSVPGGPANEYAEASTEFRVPLVGIDRARRRRRRLRR